MSVCAFCTCNCSSRSSVAERKDLNSSHVFLSVSPLKLTEHRLHPFHFITVRTVLYRTSPNSWNITQRVNHYPATQLSSLPPVRYVYPLRILSQLKDMKQLEKNSFLSFFRPPFEKITQKSHFFLTIYTIIIFAFPTVLYLPYPAKMVSANSTHIPSRDRFLTRSFFTVV